MIEIIPNWHPMLVHVTVGMLTTSVLFHIASFLVDSDFKLKRQWLYVGNWTLWIGCFFILITIMAGWYAFMTVNHDSMSHTAMIHHRNWAIPASLLFLALGVVALRSVKKNRPPHALFVASLFVGFLMLITTGWLGAEVVYRHGVGVMSLPNSDVEESMPSEISHESSHHHGDHAH
jgi:uncharacterized membrane protein